MYERDYILRLIQSVGQMLRAMTHATREHRPDDALEAARDAVEALLDTDAALVDVMTGDGLASFLSAGGTFDVLRARMLGEVLVVRAAAFDEAGSADRGESERGRARVLLQAAAPHADGEDAEHIERLLAEISSG